MRTIRLPVLVSICIALLIYLAAFVPLDTPGQVMQSNEHLALEAPILVNIAHAQDQTNHAGVVSTISDEAGISAYFKAPSKINLNDVRSLYRTIETETDNYIIGSIAIPSYPESEDAHVYIHSDGWVMAYYLKADPTGKIIDWGRYDAGASIPTKLENVLSIIVARIGAPSPNISFYHFQYPNANSLMLIAENVEYHSFNLWKGTFEFNLTGDYGYFETSWSLGSQINCGNGTAKFYLDSVEIERQEGGIGSQLQTSQGLLTTAQTLPDMFHTVEIAVCGDAAGGLAIIYRVP